MAFNFPVPSGVIGEIFNPVPGLNYRWNGAVWEVAPYVGTALPFNYVINPDFSVSQEYGNASVVAQQVYVADQWISNNGATTGSYARQRVQVVTPNASANRYRMTISTADATMFANSFLSVWQDIEGNRVAMFKYGTPMAQQGILRFGFKGPAGNWAVSIQNGALDRSYVAPFTISPGQANTDTVQTFVIPGDTTGTWAINNTLGMRLTFAFAAGSTAQGMTGWQAGHKFATSTTTFGQGTVGAVWEIYDVGWYLDPDRTGIAPRWTPPADPMTDCLRYWYPARQAFGVSASATAAGRLGNTHPVPMRAAPSVAVGAVGGNVCYAWDLVGASSITSIGNYSNTQALEFDTGGTSALSPGRACSMLPEYPGYLAVSARF